VVRKGPIRADDVVREQNDCDGYTLAVAESLKPEAATGG
jgi:hypothetical protein